MNTNDRDEFLTLLSSLCAGFNVPMTKAREHAFWTGLARMTLAAFRRCVEYALGEDYPGESMPKTGDLWRIYKRAAIPVNANLKALPAESDHILYFANRLLFLHMTHRGGLGSTGRFVPGEAKTAGMNECKASDELQRCLTFERQLVAEFSGFIRARDEFASPAGFVRFWLSGLQRVSDVLPRTIAELQAFIDDPEKQKSFPEWMGRELAQAA